MRKFNLLTPILCSVFFLLLFVAAASRYSSSYPYKEAGLNERQAAAILLDRFTYGPHPGDINKVLNEGLKNWFEDQLEGNLPEDSLDVKLAPYPPVKMDESKLLTTYVNPSVAFQEAKTAGYFPDTMKYTNDSVFQKKLKEYSDEKGYKPINELTESLIAQKILRAVYSQNQLKELMTDFWFNHFNVSIAAPNTGDYVLSYERDAIRSNALGKFRTLLEATAKHPAMLYYLNNAESVADGGRLTTAQIIKQVQVKIKYNMGLITGRQLMNQMMQKKVNNVPKNGTKKSGINENYGRELMELHTLGVDGGYTQQDVIEVARCFTGWTVLPLGTNGDKLLLKMDELKNSGFVFKDQFLFRADQHDAEQKVVLGHIIPAGGGMSDGEEVLNILAYNQATAKHISFEIAQKFVSDNPPPKLVEQMAKTFLQTKGDIKSVLRVIVESPEFWKQAKEHSKIKSPFELVASSIRALNADIMDPNPVAYWVSIIGEPLYSCLPPTGYTDNAKAWINTGALLNRMNFGLMLAEGRIKGISLNLYGLIDNHEPESVDAALITYCRLLLPERDIKRTTELLTLNIRDPKIADKIAGKADQLQENHKVKNAHIKNITEINYPKDPNVASRTLANIAGLIIGSPEFQRR